VTKKANPPLYLQTLQLTDTVVIWTLGREQSGVSMVSAWDWFKNARGMSHVGTRNLSWTNTLNKKNIFKKLSWKIGLNKAIFWTCTKKRKMRIWPMYLQRGAGAVS